MFGCSWRNHRFSLLGAMLIVLGFAAPGWSQDVFGSRVNGLISLDFSDHYITPRGLNVEDKGLITQPLMLVFWKLYAGSQGAVTDVTLTTGVWNSFHSHRSGAVPSRWNEVDPIFGLTVKFKNRLALDVGTTAFYTPTQSYETSAHAEFKLTYNDAARHGFAVNPWVAYWAELQNKATVVFDPAKSSTGGYLTLGATPTLALSAGGVTFDFPTYVNVVSANFYQKFDGSDGGSGLAVFSVAPKISVPLKFLGVTHGGWTAYGGVSYYHLSNDGLLDGNEVLVNHPEHQPNLARIRGGVSIFF